MKPSELQELVRHITRVVVNEYTSMTDTQTHDQEDSTGMSDPNVPPEDAMSPAQKAKMEREKTMNAKQELNATMDAQKTAKRESEMYKQKSGEYDRHTRKELEDKIKRLKTEI